MKCKQCGKEFEPKRKTAQYCSGKCRKLAFCGNGKKVSVPGSPRLNDNVTDHIVTPHIVTPHIVTYRLTEAQLSILPDTVARPYSGRTVWTDTQDYARTI